MLDPTRPRSVAVPAVSALLMTVLVTACSPGDDGSASPGRASSSAAGSPSTTSSSPAGATADPGAPATGATSGAPAGTAPAVPASGTAVFQRGVTARLSGLSVRQVDAEFRGEVSGPAATFTLTIANDSSARVDLGTVTVVAFDADRRPLTPVTAPFTRDLTGVAEPGASRRGVYAFTLDSTAGPAAREPLSVVVTYAASVRSVRFTGLRP